MGPGVALHFIAASANVVFAARENTFLLELECFELAKSLGLYLFGPISGFSKVMCIVLRC